VENQEELTKLVRELRVSEINDGRRYLAQEYIKNDGDYRVIVMGNKVLGAMKRSRQVEGEFRNNFSRGGKVEVAWLSEEAKALCVRAASACGLAIAGVDLVFEDDNPNKPMFWEVNRGPQFKGFMQATGIDVPREIIKLFKNLYYI
jgi:ribosomal protein S6--L-glutamate ligase